MLDYTEMVYWQQELAEAHVAEMYEKYVALGELAAMAEGERRKGALRRVARRWPGALREAELAGPARCDARRRGCEPPHRAVPRGAYPLAAIPLWADLHPLLADLLRWRARGGETRDLLGFVSWARTNGQGVWPSAARLEAVGGPRLRPQLAYAWLACRAELGSTDLDAALFRYTEGDGSGTA